jgi:phosphoglucomutase
MVVQINDFLLQKSFLIKENRESIIELPKSNVLQFITESGTKVSIRPSGTEPKIKFYFSLREKLHSKEEFDLVSIALDKRINGLKKELKLN